MEIDSTILLAAQEIAIEGRTNLQLTAEQLVKARELAKILYCPGCGSK